MCWFRPEPQCGNGVPSFAQIRADTRPSSVRQWKSGACSCRQPHHRRARPVLGTRSHLLERNWVSLGIFFCFTLITALRSLSRVCMAYKYRLIWYLKFKLECRRQFCGGLWKGRRFPAAHGDLTPEQGKAWGGRSGRQDLVRTGCIPHSPSPALLRGEESGSQEWWAGAEPGKKAGG